MILRDYQDHSVSAIFEKWRTFQSTLLCLYTGGGKTIIFADVIAKRQPGRSMVIGHREELIFQAVDKIQRTTGLQCEIEMAGQMAATNLFHRTPVVVSTIQTQMSRMDRFDPHDFSTLIIDECHHSTASSYRRLIDYYKRNKNIKILGVTATPDRTDEEALGQVFECVAANYDIRDGVHGGWLVDITQQVVTVAGLDYSHIRTTAGDLNGADLAKVMEDESNIAGICQPSLEIIHGLVPKTLDKIQISEWGQYLGSLMTTPRRFIMFTASVNQAEMCCNLFNRVLPGLCDWVCGKTNKDSRRTMLERFSRGELRGVMNCGVLTEGFDDPGVEVLIIARPTKSRSLYAQMIGRSTRPLAGVVDSPDLDTPEKRRAAIEASPKPYCRVIDFEGNAGRHKLVTAGDILGGRVSKAAVDRMLARAKKEGKPLRVCRALDNAEIELKEEKRKQAERQRRQEEARKAHLVARSKFSMSEVNPFGAEHTNAQPMPRRKGDRPFSPRQANMIRKHFGLDPNSIPYGYGVKLIKKKFEEWDAKKRKAA